MKGEIEVTVRVRDDMAIFPIEETWTYHRDNTFETSEEWIELFEKILWTHGFHPSMRLELKLENEEGEEP